jgi:hypothetical protein
MQTVAHGNAVASGKRINFKTILVKGFLWAFIGAVIGFGVSEISGFAGSDVAGLKLIGEYDLAAAVEQWEDDYKEDLESATDTFWDTVDSLGISEIEYTEIYKRAGRLSTAMWFAIISLFLGLFLGIGEGIFYGSRENAIKYGLIGAGIAVALGFVSGYLASIVYNAMPYSEDSTFTNSLSRAVAWAVAGLGVGFAVGLIKPHAKRIFYCVIGSAIGGFIGGFLFDYIYDAFTTSETDTGTLSRAIGLIVLGLLIGLGIGLLEQAAKSAWLKVIRGEFEGKEYLVFAGLTSIGNTGKNTIVLFKDKLVGPNHCDIILEGSKYTLIDKGTPMGTIVNGSPIKRQVLKQGDAISVGNTVMVFNTR